MSLPHYTEEKLLELGRQTAAQREREKVRSRAHWAAVRRLINSHPDEFKGYLEEEIKG